MQCNPSDCFPGYYAGQEAATRPDECTICPTGYYSLGGGGSDLTRCSYARCPAGTATPDGASAPSSQCVECPVNYYAFAAIPHVCLQSECTQRFPGRYAPVT
jgi:hypothetical protein